jgi:hypothetical protein
MRRYSFNWSIIIEEDFQIRVLSQAFHQPIVHFPASAGRNTFIGQSVFSTILFQSSSLDFLTLSIAYISPEFRCRGDKVPRFEFCVSLRLRKVVHAEKLLLLQLFSIGFNGLFQGGAIPQDNTSLFRCHRKSWQHQP